MSLERKITHIARASRQASLVLGTMAAEDKNRVLRRMAKAIMENKAFLMRENKKDVSLAARQKLAPALIDRLTLTEKRIQAMADGLLEVTRLRDPVGETLKVTRRPNGLLIKKVRVPIGVVAIIFESRPNVTCDCVGLCLKSGNAVILKGGKEAFYSNQAIFRLLRRSLKGSCVPPEAIQMLDSRDRAAAQILLKQTGDVDVVIPRGGEGLIRFVSENSLIPVIKHYKGVCHTYVSDRADLKMARQICFNAKVQRPGVCNAMETMLVHKNCAKAFLPLIARDLIAAGVELRGCPATRAILGKGVKAAANKDWATEYLDLILAVKVVARTREAIEHINRYGSHHSDAIITRDRKEAEIFLKSVDSACLYVNASTRFTDGYEFGLGAEIGISTDKIHARGPMALEELTSYKYVVYGSGQIRT